MVHQKKRLLAEVENYESALDGGFTGRGPGNEGSYIHSVVVKRATRCVRSSNKNILAVNLNDMMKKIVLH